MSVNLITDPKRNLFINGDMSVAQEIGSGSNSLIPGGIYGLDGWKAYRSATVTVDQSRVSDSPTFSESKAHTQDALEINPAGVEASLGTAFFTQLEQLVEGFNFRLIHQKLAGLSFWTKTNKGGEYCIYLQNVSRTRSYVKPITLSGSNVWERHNVLIQLDLAGTWDLTNSTGLRAGISLGHGTDFQTSSTDQWIAGDFKCTSSTVNFLDSASNVFRMTQARLTEGPHEVFITAGFSKQQEIAFMQRYFEKSYDLNTVPGAVTLVGSSVTVNARTTGGSQNNFTDVYKVRKRAIPTVTLYSHATGSSGFVRNESGAADVAATADRVGERSHCVSYQMNDQSPHGWHWVANARL